MLIDDTLTTNINFNKITLEHIKTINRNFLYWYKEIALLEDGRVGVVMVNHNDGHMFTMYYANLDSFIKFIHNKQCN